HWSVQAEYSDRNEEGIYFYDDYWGGPTPEPTEYSMRVKSLTPRIVGDYALDNGSLVATLGYDHIDGDYESNNGWSPVGSSQEQRSYYAQLVYPLLPKLTTTIGARQSEVDDENQLGSEQQKDDLTAGELGLSYQANDE
ncbi:TonB-dependent receptor, partial [Corallococcus praedator]|uniref:TonB-dependent receptor n=1 Tax=Corallococcus praedator TaxID=2316724 RepID=UPI0013153AF9